MNHTHIYHCFLVQLSRPSCVLETELQSWWTGVFTGRYIYIYIYIYLVHTRLPWRKYHSHYFSSQNYPLLTVFNIFNAVIEDLPIFTYMGMDQYLLIPFLGGWTSIYQLFWCSPGVQGFDTLPYIYQYKHGGFSRSQGENQFEVAPEMPPESCTRALQGAIDVGP